MFCNRVDIILVNEIILLPLISDIFTGLAGSCDMVKRG